MIYQMIGWPSLLLGWVGCFWICRELAARKHIHSDWRLSWALACLGFGTLLTLIVEISSGQRMLNALTLLSAWVALGVLIPTIAGSLARQRGVRFINVARGPHRVPQMLWCGWPLEAKLLLGCSLLLAFALGIIAWVTATTNWDSLTYHLPRVMHWIQQQSVENYPTGNRRQNEFSPWSAFVITHLHLLRGDDRLDNLVQWFSMITSVVLSTWIAGYLLKPAEKSVAAGDTETLLDISTERRVTAFTCFLVVTLPIGIVESMTPQTDYVTTCWLACAVCLALELVHDPTNMYYQSGLGLALGLGVLTKATMFIYAAPLVVAVAGWLLVRFRSARLRLRFVLVCTVTFFIVNSGHMLRNYKLVGSPISSPAVLNAERNKHLSIGTTISNVIRNLMLQTNTGVEPITHSLSEVLLFFHRFTGRELNDPDTTYQGTPFAMPLPREILDSYCSNFYHLLPIVVSGFFVLSCRRRNRKLIGYVILAVSSFLLFCAYLRWQLWHGRFHLAYFVLLMPWVAVVVVTQMPRWAIWAVSVMAGCSGLYTLTHNLSRPFLDADFMRLPREQQYTAPWDESIYESVAKVADDIVASGCQRVGLKLGFDQAEYPIWVLLHNRGFEGRIDHCYVDDVSAKIPTTSPAPEVIISSDPGDPTDTMRNAFPYRGNYGLFNVYWSEAASRWAKLSLRTTNGELAIGRQEFSIAFDQAKITLTLCSARSGRLHLSGLVTTQTDAPAVSSSLRVTTDRGYAADQSIDGQLMAFVLPLGGGTTVITLATSSSAPQNAGPVALRNFRWSWQP